MAVDAYSEAHKIECLARWILRKPLKERREFLVRMQRRHSDAFISKLKAAMIEQHGLRRVK